MIASGEAASSLRPSFTAALTSASVTTRLDLLIRPNYDGGIERSTVVVRV